VGAGITARIRAQERSMSADPIDRRLAAAERLLEEKTRALTQSQERLRALQEQLLALYRNLPNPVLRVAGSGEVLGANRAALELLGFDEAAMKGRHVGTISTFAARALRQPAGQPSPAQREETWTAASGDKIP